MKKRTVFLVDDHTLVRDGLRRIIEENKAFTVVGETGDGHEVLSNIKRLKPHILVLDLSLANAKGIHIIKKIRKFDNKTKILIVTMHKNDELVYRSLVSGADGYVLKEDADTELMKALETISNEQFYISPLLSNDVIRQFIVNQMQKTVPTKNKSLKKITPREREVLSLIVEGYSNKKIAGILEISIRTVEHHRLNIMRKLGTNNTVDLIKCVIKNRLVCVI